MDTMENIMLDNNKNIPRHVAIILDGNGRWAKKRLLPRNAGHAAGSKNVEKICSAAWNIQNFCTIILVTALRQAEKTICR